MPFVREHSGSRTSGRGDYTAIVDGVRQIVLASTARTYSYFDALSRLRRVFFGRWPTLQSFSAGVASKGQAF
jgi:hypothetical protein